MKFLSPPPRLSVVPRSRCRTLRCMFRRIPPAMRHGAPPGMPVQCAIPFFGGGDASIEGFRPCGDCLIPFFICHFQLFDRPPRGRLPRNARQRHGVHCGGGVFKSPAAACAVFPASNLRRLRAFSGGLDNRVLSALGRAFGGSRGGNVLTLFPPALYFYFDGRKFF